MKQKIIVVIACSMLIMSACKTTRQVAKPTLPTTSTEISQLVENVKKVQPQFKTANISKMSMAFNVNEREVNVSAVCKMIKDSAIFISIQPFM